ncbi:MAG: hypothetical protein JWQ09_1318 [Segetibacter sp.]|nr:hypothetical protein [Segetibacter sp.]
MNLQKEDLPATIQAFELEDNKEIFLAEQVVNSQSEIETFTNRYAGKLIKAKKVPVKEVNSYSESAPAYRKKRSSSTGLIMMIILLILIALVIYGFSTGWIQETFHLKV